MNTKPIDSVKGNSSLIRPIFSPGLLLQDSDLTDTVEYMRNMTRLLFRSLFGCGVVCGLKVAAKEECGKLRIGVAKGVALDCEGNPIEIPSEKAIDVDLTCTITPPKQLWIAVRRLEQACAVREVMCAPEDDETTTTATRSRDGYEIKLFSEQPKCVCGCITTEPPKSGATSKCCQDDTANQGTTSQTGNSITSPATNQDKENKADLGCHGCGGEEIDPCYKAHYEGECECCNGYWVLVAKVEKKLIKTGEPETWLADHSVRRFVRPCLVKDPMRQSVKPKRPETHETQPAADTQVNQG
jgi:hypothetical protein